MSRWIENPLASLFALEQEHAAAFFDWFPRNSIICEKTKGYLFKVSKLEICGCYDK